MEEDRVGLRGLEAVPRLGQHVEQHRPLRLLHQLQVADQVRQRVSLDGAEVANAERFEEHAAVERRLDRVLHVEQHPLHRLADHRHALDQFRGLALEAAVPGVLADDVEVFGQPADAGADRHLVVVEDHQQPFLEEAGVVERLEDDSRGQRAVADHRHRRAVGAAAEIVAAGQAERRRDARPRVARHEEVVGALVGVGKAHQSAAGADRAEPGETAGDQLVRVDLVAGVPDQPVAAEVEHPVQRQAELHHSEIGGEMGRSRGGDLAQRPAHLGGQLLELLRRQPLQVARGKDGGEKVGHGCGNVLFCA